MGGWAGPGEFAEEEQNNRTLTLIIEAEGKKIK